MKEIFKKITDVNEDIFCNTYNNRKQFLEQQEELKEIKRKQQEEENKKRQEEERKRQIEEEEKRKELEKRNRLFTIY